MKSYGQFPEPWHMFLTESGYILTRDCYYVLYYRLSAALSVLWRHPYVTLTGPRYAPTTLSLLAPHLAAGSRLLTRILAGGSKQPDFPSGSVRDQREELWWRQYFASLDREAAIALEPDRIHFRLSAMILEQQVRLLSAVGVLLAPECFDAASHQTSLAAIEVVGAPYWRRGVLESARVAVGLSRGRDIPIGQLGHYLVALHAQLNTTPVAPLPEQP